MTSSLSFPHPLLAERIYRTSHLTGEFTLRSGAKSSEYFDKYLFEAEPGLLRDIAEAMAPLIAPEAEALAGLEMGGIPLAVMLSQITRLPLLFVRKKAKDYGTCKIAEGGSVSQRKLVLVEDVITSGGAVLDAAAALRAEGANLLHVVCVIDRESKGSANLLEIDLPMRALFTMSQLKQAGTPSNENKS